MLNQPFLQVTLPLMVTIVVAAAAATIAAWVSNANMSKRIDDLVASVNARFAEISGRLLAIEGRLTRIEDRLGAVEKKVDALELTPWR